MGRTGTRDAARKWEAVTSYNYVLNLSAADLRDWIASEGLSLTVRPCGPGAHVAELRRGRVLYCASREHVCPIAAVVDVIARGMDLASDLEARARVVAEVRRVTRA